MKSIKVINLWLLLLCLGLTFTACTEDDDPIIKDPTTPEAAAAPSPVLGPGDGAFWAINSVTTTTVPITTDTEIGTAVAFMTNDNFNTFTDAGKVSITAKDLTKNANQSYVYIPGFADPFGLQFGGSYEWTVGGAGAIAGFSHTVDFAFPDLGAITSGNEVSKSGYTLTCQSVSRADSIIYQVGEVIKTVAGNVTSVEFTADDLKDVTAGPSVVQIAAYTYQAENINSKTYYFGNETVRSQVVEIK